MAYFHVKDTTISTITAPSHTMFVIDEIYDSQYSPAQTGGEGVDLDSYITYTTTSTLSANATGAATGGVLTSDTQASQTASPSSSFVVYTNSSSTVSTNGTAASGSSATTPTLSQNAVTSTSTFKVSGTSSGSSASSTAATSAGANIAMGANPVVLLSLVWLALFCRRILQ